jgi:hypothetical protein
MWTFAYVGKESSKIVPTWIEFNSTATVVFISWVVWTATTLTYLAPSCIQRVTLAGFATRKTMAVIWIVLSVGVVFALTDSFLSKSACSYDSKSTANATAEPHSFFVTNVSTNQSNHGQSTKTFICDIDGFGHRTAAPVRRSSGEVGVDSATSLRTIARRGLL